MAQKTVRVGKIDIANDKLAAINSATFRFNPRGLTR